MHVHKKKCRLLVLALGVALSLRAASETPAPAETAEEILARVVDAYSKCDSYSARICIRQVFFSPAISIFQKVITAPQKLGPIHYQSITVRMRRPGNWQVGGTLTSELSPLAGRNTEQPTTAYLYAQADGGPGKLARIDATNPGQVEDLSASDFAPRLKARLFGEGLLVLEPLFGSGKNYTPVEFPLGSPQLEGVEEVPGRTLYRIRTQATNGLAMLMWIDKASALIVHTLTFKQEEMQQFTETFFYEQDLHPVFAADSFVFTPPDHVEPLSSAEMGFADLYGYASHLPEMVRPKPSETPREVTNELSSAQLAGVVFLEGDNSLATGFIAKVRDIAFVVTNLHVLGTNHSILVRSTRGTTIQTQGVIGAVGQDIALLRITNPPADLAVLQLADDVLLTAKVDDDVVVVGNRLGGGVASQTKGKVLAFGPSNIETSAQFQSGNSGSPIFDLRTNDVIGVAAFSETVTLKTPTNPLFLHSEDLRNFKQQEEQRWFGFRLDGVTKWETIDLAKWRDQHAQLDHFRDNSLALLAFLDGDLQTAKENVQMRELIEQNDTRVNPSNRAGLEGINIERADQLDSLMRALRAFCDQGVRELQAGQAGFYGYFRTNPYWTVSIPDQLRFRSILKSEIDYASKDLLHVKQDLLKHM